MIQSRKKSKKEPTVPVTWEAIHAAQRSLNMITPQNAHLFIKKDDPKP